MHLFEQIDRSTGQQYNAKARYADGLNLFWLLHWGFCLVLRRSVKPVLDVDQRTGGRQFC